MALYTRIISKTRFQKLSYLVFNLYQKYSLILSSKILKAELHLLYVIYVYILAQLCI